MANLQDLTGITEDDLRALMAQLGPSAEDRTNARQAAILNFGLGLLGARRGEEMSALGHAGLMGANTYQTALQQAAAERKSNLGMAMQLAQAKRAQDAAKAFTSEDGPGPVTNGVQPEAGVSPKTAGLFGGTTPGAMPQTGFANLPPAPLSVPRGTPPASINGYVPPNFKREMPAALRATIAATMDPKEYAKYASEWSETKVGPDGTVSTKGGRPLYRQSDAGIQYFNPDGTPAQFVPYGQAASDAAAARSATIRGAETAATEAAQAPYRTTTTAGPRGEPMLRYVQDVAGPPRLPNAPAPLFGGGQPATASPGGGALFSLNMRNAPLDQIKAAVADMERNAQPGAPAPAAAPTAAGPSLGARFAPNQTGPSPVDMRAMEGKVSAQTSQDTEIAKSYGERFVGWQKADQAAPTNIAKLNMLQSYLSKVDTGKAAPTVQTLKQYATYFAPKLSESWTADVPFAEAATALSREMALELRNPTGGAGMPGALSNSDRQYLESMTPNISTNPRAIPMMIEARIAMEKRSQQVAALAREYRKTHGAIDEGFDQVVADFAEKNPLFSGAALGTGTKETSGRISTAKTDAAPAAKTVVQTGTLNGRRVVRYSDGSMEYAQ